MRIVGVVSVLALGGVLAACSSSSGGGGTPGDSGTSDAASDSGGACNSVAKSGPVVTITCASGAVPAGTGGTIVDGTYNLTAHVRYLADGGACSGGTDQSTEVIAGTSVQVIGGTGALSGTITVSGAMLTFNITCPSAASGVDTFTATPTTLTIFDAMAGRVYTYTKQ